MDFLVGVVMDIAAEVGIAAGEKTLVDWDKTEQVIGVDENKNGLRDDFEKMLISRVSDDPHRNALYHMMHYMNETLVFGSTRTKTEADAQEAVQIFEKYQLPKIFQCLPRKHQSLYTYIDKNFPNTQVRKEAYNNFNTIYASAKPRVNRERVNCDLFLAGLPNYTATDFKAAKNKHNQVINSTSSSDATIQTVN